MLVLTRRQNDKIVFPNLGISVEVLRVSGNAVRVGVKAPSDVTILRHEVAERQQKLLGQEAPPVERPAPRPLERKLSHALRNRLNAATLGLHLLHRKLEQGEIDDADSAIMKIFKELQSLEQEVSAASANKSRKARPKGRPRTLLVEDDANEAELLAGFLRSFDFTVDTVPDGREALSYLKRETTPHVVLLDMLMPRMDGPTTIRAIRSEPAYQDLRIFAVSGTEPSELGVTTGPKGIDRWFRKPLNPQVLVNEIATEVTGAA